MNKFLADIFSQVVSMGAAVLLLVVLCSGLAAMIQSFWVGVSVIVGGSIVVVTAFGALAVILSLYEEVKAIRKFLVAWSPPDQDAYMASMDVNDSA